MTKLTFKATRGRIVFNPDDDERRWSAPNPEHEDYSEARHRARYPEPGQKPNYNAASLADTYQYLVTTCPTTRDACQQLREIRRAVRELRRAREGSEKL